MIVKLKYAWWRLQERWCKTFGHNWQSFSNEYGTGKECPRCYLGFYNL